MVIFDNTGIGSTQALPTPLTVDAMANQSSERPLSTAAIRAAYRMSAERGYDATTVADIAAAAEVAPRTVAMYFPSKQDIALSRFGEAADELTRALRERDPGETAPQVLARWLRTDERPDDREIKQLSKRLFAANPELIELADTPPGDERDVAIDTAMRFLDAGIAAL